MKTENYYLTNLKIMSFKTAYRFVLGAILFCIGLLFVYSVSFNSKYYVRYNDITYSTDSIYYIGNCIKFTPVHFSKERTVCGDFVVLEN